MKGNPFLELSPHYESRLLHEPQDQQLTPPSDAFSTWIITAQMLGPSKLRVTYQSTHPRVAGVHLFPPKDGSICSQWELQHSEDQHHHQHPLWIKTGMVGAWPQRGAWGLKVPAVDRKGSSRKSNLSFISSFFYVYLCYDASSVDLFLFIQEQSPFIPSIWNLIFLKNSEILPVIYLCIFLFSLAILLELMLDVTLCASLCASC